MKKHSPLDIRSVKQPIRFGHDGAPPANFTPIADPAIEPESASSSNMLASLEKITTILGVLPRYQKERIIRTLVVFYEVHI